MGMLPVLDELLKRIADLANASRLPLEAQAEKLLLESIERSEAAVDLRRLMDSIAAMTPKGVTQTDSVELLREDRSR